MSWISIPLSEIFRRLNVGDETLTRRGLFPNHPAKMSIATYLGYEGATRFPYLLRSETATIGVFVNLDGFVVNSLSENGKALV